jgi:hypothetical protein
MRKIIALCIENTKEFTRNVQNLSRNYCSKGFKRAKDVLCFLIQYSENYSLAEYFDS